MRGEDEGIGRVVACAHCHGKGNCDCAVCNKDNEPSPQSHYKVTCSACKGVGSVWVGPSTVIVNKK